MKAEWLVIAKHLVAVNVAETGYTLPVVPREPFGLKMGKVHLPNYIFNVFVSAHFQVGADLKTYDRKRFRLTHFTRRRVFWRDKRDRPRVLTQVGPN
jgi:hypothetical protein